MLCRSYAKLRDAYSTKFECGILAFVATIEKSGVIDLAKHFKFNGKLRMIEVNSGDYILKSIDKEKNQIRIRLRKFYREPQFLMLAVEDKV